MSEPTKALEPGGTRQAKCSDCGVVYEVTQVAWDLALMFHKVLLARGEPGMDGVGRCDDCGKAWRAQMAQEDEQRSKRDTVLFVRMRTALAAIDHQRASRQDIRRFLDELPGDFAVEHNAAVASFRAAADERFTKRDKSQRTGDDFKG
jgi:hypothetical protein